MAKANSKATTGGCVSVVRGGEVVCESALVDEPNAMAHRTGYFRLWVERDGKVIQDTGYIENGYTNAGMAATAKKMSGADTVADFDYLAVGSDNTAFDDGQTILVSEIDNTNGCGRAIDASPTTTTTAFTDDTMVINKSWTVTGTETVQEIGCFNASSTGDMIGRSVVAPSVGVADGDTLNGEYTVQFG